MGYCIIRDGRSMLERHCRFLGSKEEEMDFSNVFRNFRFVIIERGPAFRDINL